jgi:hypothetical protein
VKDVKKCLNQGRMINGIYKKHKVVKEELYDHEKDDKEPVRYRQKPKFVKCKR